MEINPRKAGQCWSCKYCQDIGTHTYEDYVTYMRQCSYPGLDVIDNCPRSCEHYVWDGRTREYWREDLAKSSTSSNSASGGTSPALDSGTRAAIAVIAAALVVIGVIVFLLLQPAKTADNGPASPAYSDNADYSLAGEIRIVVTQSGKGVYMRSEPRSDASVVSGIPDNQTVTIQKTVDNWAYVSFDGCEGWCSMTYLVTEEAHGQVMQEYLNVPAIVVTESTDLRLRATPSLEGETIESMPKGSQVTVMRLEGDWAYVDYQGMSGWCAAQYLEIQE